MSFEERLRRLEEDRESQRQELVAQLASQRQVTSQLASEQASQRQELVLLRHDIARLDAEIAQVRRTTAEQIQRECLRTWDVVSRELSHTLTAEQARLVQDAVMRVSLTAACHAQV